jgi:hypothetical protein
MNGLSAGGCSNFPTLRSFVNPQGLRVVSPGTKPIQEVDERKASRVLGRGRSVIKPVSEQPK